MANVTASDFENPFGLCARDLQFIDNLIESLPTNSRHDSFQNETQKEPNEGNLPTSPDNSNDVTSNGPICSQKENETYNALELCLPNPSGYFDFETSPGSSHTAPIYFQDTGPSCEDFNSESSINANRGKTTNKSANHSDTDAFDWCNDRPDPPGIN